MLYSRLILTRHHADPWAPLIGRARDCCVGLQLNLRMLNEYSSSLTKTFSSSSPPSGRNRLAEEESEDEEEVH